jgi:RNA polymerase sigma-70 factor (family 1)
MADGLFLGLMENNPKSGLVESPLHPARGHTDAKLLDEELLIRKTFESDPKQGCEILFRKYYHLLCSHAVRLVHSSEIAEDLVSELFAKLWTGGLYRNINTSYRAYLFKAVRFSAYNYVRYEMGKTEKMDKVTAWHDPLFCSFKPEETLLFDELSHEIDQIISQLPTQCRTVFILSRFGNRKYKEIADKLGISVKSVEAHITKALDLLRKRLKATGMASITLAAILYLP